MEQARIQADDTGSMRLRRASADDDDAGQGARSAMERRWGGERARDHVAVRLPRAACS